MRILLPLAAITALTACSQAPAPPPAAPDPPQAAASSHPVKTPWDALLKDRDKAKAVQGTVDDYAKRQQKAIDAQSH